MLLNCGAREDSRVSWTARRLNQSILKEINSEYSLEGLMLKLKLQYFGHLMWRANSLEKTLMMGKIEGRRRRGTTEDEMAGCHHRLNGHEFEQAPGVGDGQGGLASCSLWDRKQSAKLRDWTTDHIIQGNGGWARKIIIFPSDTFINLSESLTSCETLGNNLSGFFFTKAWQWHL